jgi:hypothetical protein
MKRDFCPNFNFSTRNYDRQGNESKWFFFIFLSYVPASIQFECIYYAFLFISELWKIEERRWKEEKNLNFSSIFFRCRLQIELFIVHRNENFVFALKCLDKNWIISLFLESVKTLKHCKALVKHWKTLIWILENIGKHWLKESEHKTRKNT